MFMVKSTRLIAHTRQNSDNMYQYWKLGHTSIFIHLITGCRQLHIHKISKSKFMWNFYNLSDSWTCESPKKHLLMQWLGKQKLTWLRWVLLWDIWFDMQTSSVASDFNNYSYCMTIQCWPGHLMTSSVEIITFPMTS